MESTDLCLKNRCGVGYRDFPKAEVMVQKTALKGIYNPFKAVYNVVPFLLVTVHTPSSVLDSSGTSLSARVHAVRRPP